MLIAGLKDDQKNICPYQRREIFTAIRRRQVSRPHSRWVLIEQSAHEPINFFLRQSCTKQERCQIRITPVFQRQNGETFVPTAEGANSLAVEFLDAVARLEPDFAELRDALDQGGQSRVHQRLLPLSLDNGREHEFVLP
jgi:hypothetical protein